MAPLLVKSVLLGPFGHLALASQSQIPLRTGDCVEATQWLEYFHKDDGEYETTDKVFPRQTGVLLNLGDGHDPSDVEWLHPDSRDPSVTGVAFSHQFSRVPWVQGAVKGLQGANARCLTAHPSNLGYAPMIKMSACDHDNPDKFWQQQFTFGYDTCGARPIRYTKDPSKCVDAVHYQHVILSDCNGADTQKFLWKCDRSGGQQPDCYIQRAGRKDMCLWWDHSLPEADLQIRSCNFGEDSDHHFAQLIGVQLEKDAV
jgi:hypothetical protein